MASVFELLDDERICEKIRQRLPYLFVLAELEASRAGRVGMEIGTLREQILIALLIYKFGEENVNLDIPITMPEVDVMIFGRPLSIKTVTAKSKVIPAVKVVWTVDWQRVQEFVEGYRPKSDMLLVMVRWESEGGFYLVPESAQEEVFVRLGRENYLHIPKRGTNPRGVEISRKAIARLITHPQTKGLTIKWHRPTADLKEGERRLAPYKRWLQYWQLRRGAMRWRDEVHGQVLSEVLLASPTIPPPSTAAGFMKACLRSKSFSTESLLYLLNASTEYFAKVLRAWRNYPIAPSTLWSLRRHTMSARNTMTI